MTTSRPNPTVTMRPALDHLARLAELGPDWDSYGGVPPTAEAVATARRLVLAVANELVDVAGVEVRPHTVAPLADGCVQLTWRGRSDELEVEVGPRDDIGYLLVKRQGSEETFQEAEGVSSSEILELIGRVVRDGNGRPG